MTRTMKRRPTREANQALATLGLHNTEDLPVFLEHCNEETCVQACHIAGVFRVRECIPILVRILERANTAAIAWESAIALSLIGSRTCVRPLLEVARQHTLEEAKEAAIHALGVLGDYRAEPILSRIALDIAYRDGTRARAAEAMGSMRLRSNLF
jgi:HEAT repeat protein